MSSLDALSFPHTYRRFRQAALNTVAMLPPEWARFIFRGIGLPLDPTWNGVALNYAQKLHVHMWSLRNLPDPESRRILVRMFCFLDPTFWKTEHLPILSLLDNLPSGERGPLIHLTEDTFQILANKTSSRSYLLVWLQAFAPIPHDQREADSSLVRQILNTQSTDGEGLSYRLGAQLLNAFTKNPRLKESLAKLPATPANAFLATALEDCAFHADVIDWLLQSPRSLPVKIGDIRYLKSNLSQLCSTVDQSTFLTLSKRALPFLQKLQDSKNIPFVSDLFLFLFELNKLPTEFDSLILEKISFENIHSIGSLIKTICQEQTQNPKALMSSFQNYAPEATWSSKNLLFWFSIWTNPSVQAESPVALAKELSPDDPFLVLRLLTEAEAKRPVKPLIQKIKEHLKEDTSPHLLAQAAWILCDSDIDIDIDIAFDKIRSWTGGTNVKEMNPTQCIQILRLAFFRCSLGKRNAFECILRFPATIDEIVEVFEILQRTIPAEDEQILALAPQYAEIVQNGDRIRILRNALVENPLIPNQLGVNVHADERDTRTGKMLQQLFTHCKEKGLYLSPQAPVEFMVAFEKLHQLPHMTAQIPTKERTAFLQKKALIQRALLSPKVDEEPFGPFIGGEPFSFNGTFYQGKEIFMAVWAFIQSQTEKIRERAIEELATALADCIDDGHQVCNQGKAQRILTAVLQGTSNFPSIDTFDNPINGERLLTIFFMQKKRRSMETETLLKQATLFLQEEKIEPALQESFMKELNRFISLTD